MPSSSFPFHCFSIISFSSPLVLGEYHFSSSGSFLPSFLTLPPSVSSGFSYFFVWEGVEMMKRMKKVVPMEASSSSYPVVGGDSRARFKLQSLIQEYDDLLMETEVMRNRLQARKQHKSQLAAEVKFLRRKYEHLIRNKNGTTLPSKHSSLKPQIQKARHTKKAAQRVSTISANKLKAPEFANLNKFSAKERKHRNHEAANPSTSSFLDLNQISVLSEDEEGILAPWEPLRMEKLTMKQYQVEGDSASCDTKLLICRNVGDQTSRTGKRKITWQDQVALRV